MQRTTRLFAPIIRHPEQFSHHVKTFLVGVGVTSLSNIIEKLDRNENNKEQSPTARLKR